MLTSYMKYQSAYKALESIELTLLKGQEGALDKEKSVVLVLLVY